VYDLKATSYFKKGLIDGKIDFRELWTKLRFRTEKIGNDIDLFIYFVDEKDEPIAEYPDIRLTPGSMVTLEGIWFQLPWTIDGIDHGMKWLAKPEKEVDGEVIEKIKGLIKELVDFYFHDKRPSEKKALKKNVAKNFQPIFPEKEGGEDMADKVYEIIFVYQDKIEDKTKAIERKVLDDVLERKIIGPVRITAQTEREAIVWGTIEVAAELKKKADRQTLEVQIKQF
jgi:hypothetical protein